MELKQAVEVAKDARNNTPSRVRLACHTLLFNLERAEIEIKRLSDIVDRQNLEAALIIKNNTNPKGRK